MWLLIMVPVLLAGYVLAQRRRSRFALRYSSLSIVRDAVQKGPGARRHIPPALFLIGCGVLIFALARPYTLMTLFSSQATIILTIDVSGSMRAQDLKPSRIDAAKKAAIDFVKRQGPDTRIGVVSFSGTAALVQEPTTDHELLTEAIARLNTQRATAIGSGIMTSLNAIAEALGQDLPPLNEAPLAVPDRRPGAPPPPIARPAGTPVPKGVYAPAIIVLLTDGQNTTGPSPLDASLIAADRGIRVYTIGIGTPEGAVLGQGGFGGGPGGQGGQGGFGGGGGGFRAMLDETTLRKIAKQTDAKYYYAATETDLHDIYEALDTTIVSKPQQIEATALATAGGAALFLLGGLLSLFWFNRLP
ncbi:MAG: VWA domain-containing protein [Chloroflexi bacterium]|nr:VWA domain-containing protein [Chloroflexota bacterium]